MIAPRSTNHQCWNLKKGDLAYVVFKPGVVSEVIITGPCRFGHGYKARKADAHCRGAYEEIDTCGKFLSPLRPDSMREAFRQLVEEKDDVVRRIGDLQPRLASLQDSVDAGVESIRVIEARKGGRR